MSVSHKFTIAAIGGSGPKATAINFVKNDDGVRLWTWLSNDVASKVRPGMTVTAEQASLGKVETTYEKGGKIEELKVPRQQVFLGGAIVFGKPESEALAPVTIVFEDGCDEYAAAFDAKNAGRPTIVINEEAAF